MWEGLNRPSVARNVRYTVGIWTGAPGEAEGDRQHFAEQVGSAAAFIDAAIYELELDPDPETATVPAVDQSTQQRRADKCLNGLSTTGLSAA
jgi:hypothetical protein